MQRVAAKRLVRFVLLDYLRDLGNGSPHLKRDGELKKKAAELADAKWAFSVRWHASLSKAIESHELLF
jgi:hypothetical protein